MTAATIGIERKKRSILRLREGKRRTEEDGKSEREKETERRETEKEWKN